MTQLVSGFFGFFRVTDRNLSPIKQGLWSNGAYRQQDNNTINKLQKLEDALVEQMLTGLTGLIRLTGLIGVTMCKMYKM